MTLDYRSLAQHTHAEKDRHTNKYIPNSTQKAGLKEGKVREKSGERQRRREQDRGPLHAPVSAHRRLITTTSHSTVRTVKELLQTTANGPWNVTQCSTRSSARFAFTHTRIPAQHTITTTNEGGGWESVEQWKWDRKLALYTCTVCAHCCYGLFQSLMLSHFCQYRLGAATNNYYHCWLFIYFNHSFTL